MGLGVGICGAGIGPKHRIATGSTPAPTVTVSVPSASFELSEGGTLTISGTCTDSASVETQYRVAAGAWTTVGTDSTHPSGGTFTTSKTLAGADAGAVDVRAIATGSGGTATSSTVSGTVVALPTVSISAPSANAIYDLVTDVSLAVSGTCDGASTVEVLVSVNGGAFGSWGTDSSVGSGTWSITRTLMSGDVGDTVTLKARATNSAGGYTDSATVTIEIIDIANMAASYYWLAPGQVEAAATRVSDPTIPGAGWSGTNWSGSGLGPYTHTAGSTTALSNACLTQYLRYLVTYTISGRTAGTLTGPGGTARSTNGTFSGELTAASTACAFTPSSDFDGAVTVVSIACLSVSALGKTSGGLAGFAQATAASQPWIGQTAINGCKPVQFSSDRIDSTSAWDFSSVASATLIMPARYAAQGAIELEHSDTTATNVGFYLGVDASNYCTGGCRGSTAGPAYYKSASTHDGSSGIIIGYTPVSASPPPTMTFNGSGDTVNKTSGTDPTGVFASQTMHIGARVSGTAYPWTGEVFGLYVCAGTLGSTDKSRVRRYMGQSRLLGISTT